MSSYIGRNNIFEEFFRELSPGFLIKPLQSENLPQLNQIRLDIGESDELYTIEAEVPGMAKDAIRITIDGNTVHLKAEQAKEETRSSDSWIKKERNYGAISRSVTLPKLIDSLHATARYDNGILTLSLPKAVPTVSRELKID